MRDATVRRLLALAEDDPAADDPAVGHHDDDREQTAAPHLTAPHPTGPTRADTVVRTEDAA